jgi:hypothetical protein
MLNNRYFKVIVDDAAVPAILTIVSLFVFLRTVLVTAIFIPLFVQAHERSSL